MSCLTPLSTIESNLSQTKEDDENSFDELSSSPLKMKKLPKWLLEFDSFSLNESKFKSETNGRPLTESCVRQRPQWFKELAQQRRSSEVFTSIETKSELFRTNAEKLDSNGFDGRAVRRKSRRIESNQLMSDDINVAKSFVSIPNQTDTYFEPIVNRNSLKNTFKSCENLLLEIDDNLNDFIIPELPFGQLLVFEIATNWGDEDYIGLNGIEVLDLDGTDLNIEKMWSEPQTTGDLQTLFDGIYRTHDDSHLWLTQLESKSQLPLKIFIRFESKISIALIRIWNYNKSRIYSYRGIKFLTISLDNKLIFKGEIAKASGTLIGSIEAFGDTILFTTDENVLESVALRDQSFQELVDQIFPLRPE